jgi:hypothetical protein
LAAGPEAVPSLVIAVGGTREKGPAPAVVEGAVLPAAEALASRYCPLRHYLPERNI